MFSVEPLLLQCRELLALPELQIVISGEWNSTHAHHRELLRAELSQRTGFDLRNLEFPPQAPGYSISISHCPAGGGFALLPLRCDIKFPQRVSIGLDIEETARVRSTTVGRISTPHELANAPSAAHLWCAKEAAFKGLARKPEPHSPDVNEAERRPEFRPLVLSDLLVQRWSHAPGQLDGLGASAEKAENLRVFLCEISDSRSQSTLGTGCTFEVGNLTIAVFIKTPI